MKIVREVQGKILLSRKEAIDILKKALEEEHGVDITYTRVQMINNNFDGFEISFTERHDKKKGIVEITEGINENGRKVGFKRPNKGLTKAIEAAFTEKPVWSETELWQKISPQFPELTKDGMLKRIGSIFTKLDLPRTGETLKHDPGRGERIAKLVRNTFQQRKHWTHDELLKHLRNSFRDLDEGSFVHALKKTLKDRLKESKTEQGHISYTIQ